MTRMMKSEQKQNALSFRFEKSVRLGTEPCITKIGHVEIEKALTLNMTNFQYKSRACVVNKLRHAIMYKRRAYQ